MKVHMLDDKGFDMWAGGYDESVGIADDNDDYPFAGYRRLMNAVYAAVMEKCPARVLDIGIGTGTLAARLYERGNDITGIDFSGEMLARARARMPGARLIQFDFAQGLPCDISAMKFDFIISTYALHHLTDDEKIIFIPSLLDCLDDGGAIIIGDVGFTNRKDLEKCKAACGDGWDDDEFYFIFSELADRLNDKCNLKYYQVSYCAGIMEITESIL